MIGDRLWDLRKDAGLTQDELAEILNINKHSISSYERDRSEPSDSIKIAIAKYFGVSVDYLLGVTDDPSPHDGRNRNILKLPHYFPQEAKQSLQDYIAFLMQHYDKQK